jgi:hypothetical protein
MSCQNKEPHDPEGFLSHHRADRFARGVQVARFNRPSLRACIIPVREIGDVDIHDPIEKAKRFGRRVRMTVRTIRRFQSGRASARKPRIAIARRIEQRALLAVTAPPRGFAFRLRPCTARPVISESHLIAGHAPWLNSSSRGEPGDRRNGTPQTAHQRRTKPKGAHMRNENAAQSLPTRVDTLPAGTFLGGDEIPAGTFHGGDEIPPGTFHAGS